MKRGLVVVATLAAALPWASVARTAAARPTTGQSPASVGAKPHGAHAQAPRSPGARMSPSAAHSAAPAASLDTKVPQASVAASARPGGGGKATWRASRLKAGPSAPSDLEVVVDPVARARSREALMAARAEAAERRARAHALLAYRLARRRSSELWSEPARRAQTARALDAAWLVLRRSAGERSAWRRELAQASADRSSLERRLGQTGGGGLKEDAGDGHGAADSAEEPTTLARRASSSPGMLVLVGVLGPGASLAAPPAASSWLHWPARGATLSAPGLRRDPATATESRGEGIELLARLNDPVHAVADGHVRKVAALPQGGYAVVLAHDQERISIVSGLRQVDVTEGAAVKAGSPIGLVGRDLDGAPVLGFELWQDGAPIDPRPLLPARPR